MIRNKTKNIFCNKHQVYHRIFPKYSSCIEDKTMILKESSLRMDNHKIGCNLEAYAQTLRFRGNTKEADELDRIASRIK